MNRVNLFKYSRKGHQMMYRMSAIMSLGVLLASSLQAQTGISYPQLKYWYMCSQGIDQKNFIAQQPQLSEAQEGNKEPDFNLPTFSEQERALKLYDILNNVPVDYFTATGQTKEQADSLLILARDLEVYCGEGKHPEVNLASRIDRSLSAAGSIVLRRMLASPIAFSDTEKFDQRQLLVKQLISDQSLFEAVDELCRSWAENEDHMLSNWQDLDEVGSALLKECYFNASSLKRFNNNPHVMECLTRAGNASTVLQMTGDIILLYLEFSCIAKLESYGKSQPISWSQAFKETFDGAIELAKKINPRKYYGLYKDILRQVDEEVVVKYLRDEVNKHHCETQAEADRLVEQLIPQLDQQAQQDRQFKHRIITGGFVAIPALASLFVGLKAYTCKNIYNHAVQIKDTVNFIQKRLIGMSNAVRSVVALENLNEQYSVLGQGLVSWQHAQDLLHSSEQNNFTNLVDLLLKDTFTGDASFFSLSGRVLAAHTLMEQERDKFAGMIELMGELDACLSIAKLYKQFEQRRVNYCFADLHNTNRPYMKIQSFWNPFVDYTVVVPNDIELGGDQTEQSVILTGSNTGGKSTIGLKGSLIGLYLAHTLGIAPAELCEASRFTDFCSYLHVLDDVASGESSFQAEVNRANTLIKAVKQLPRDQFAFIVIDELFKGTSPEKGSPGAYRVVKHLAGYDNVMFIIATHFKELTQLEQDTQGHCVNMKIEIHEDEYGNLIKPYKLERGISVCNVADAIMQSNLDEINFDL